MSLTDLFIRRPVLSVVVSVFVLLLGLGAEQRLPVRQFPRTVNAMIEVDTTYYGANADVVAGFITTPLENAISRVDGIDYISSSSSTGSSRSPGAKSRLKMSVRSCSYTSTARLSAPVRFAMPAIVRISRHE